MAKFKGIDYVVKVNTGDETTPNFVAVAGQRGGTLNRSADSIDVTSKDSGGWKENLQGLKEWSIDTDGLMVDTDTGYAALEDAYMNGTDVMIELALPNGNTYSGKAIITDFPVEIPYDDAVTYSVSFVGNGALTSAATV